MPDWRGYLTAMRLDFYRVSEHIYAATHGCLGPGTQAAEAWAKARPEEIKTLRLAAVLAAIEELARSVPTDDQRQCLRRLRNYLTERLEMLQYKDALANHWDIGSGPSEVQCNTPL